MRSLQKRLKIDAHTNTYIHIYTQMHIHTMLSKNCPIAHSLSFTHVHTEKKILFILHHSTRVHNIDNSSETVLCIETSDSAAARSVYENACVCVCSTGGKNQLFVVARTRPTRRPSREWKQHHMTSSSCSSTSSAMYM